MNISNNDIGKFIVRYRKLLLYFAIFLFWSTSCFGQNWDIDILKDINLNRNRSLDSFFRIVTDYAAPIAYSVPVFLLLLAILKRNFSLKERSLYIIQSSVLALIVSTLVKHIVNRPRPFITYPFIEKITSGGSPSFPSGHTSDAFTLAASLSFAFPKWYVIIPSFFWAVAVGYSRMDLGVHYPSDILGSIIIGILSAYICYLIFEKRKNNTIQKLSGQIPIYVTKLFKKHQTPALLYHNTEHTQYVVERTREIAANYSLNPIEVFILSTAAWFHDTGQLFGNGINHEEKSVSIMRSYLENKGIEAKIIDRIEACILATSIPHHPKSFLEEVLCDADTFNLGNDDFLTTNKLLKKECELRGTLQCDNWEKNTLNLLEHHKYYTSYCQNLLEKGKQKNIEVVRSQLTSE